MRTFLIVALTLFLSVLPLLAQHQNASNPPPPARPAPDYSGMYSFLKDGEFVQLTVEDNGHVTGFVSRFGDLESDRGAFLDQFFKEAKLEGNKLTFTTETVHGVWWGFKGTIERGPGKNPGDEAYYVLKGMLTQYSGDQDKKTAPKSREVELKSFPSDVSPASQKKD